MDIQGHDELPQAVHALLLELGTNSNRQEQIDDLALDLAFIRARRLAREAARKRRSIIGLGAASALGTAILGAIVTAIFPGAVEWLSTHVPVGLPRPPIK